MLLEAISTVDWSARRRHKRHFCICAAVRAFDLRHLPRGTVTSILITQFLFHRPYSLVIRKIILAAIIGTGLTAIPSSTQVRSQVYIMRNMEDYYKRCAHSCDHAKSEKTSHLERSCEEKMARTICRWVWYKRNIMRRTRLVPTLQAAPVLNLLESSFLLLAGIYLSVERFSNTLYWRSSSQPWFFRREEFCVV